MLFTLLLARRSRPRLSTRSSFAAAARSSSATAPAQRVTPSRRAIARITRIAIAGGRLVIDRCPAAARAAIGFGSRW